MQSRIDLAVISTVHIDRSDRRIWFTGSNQLDHSALSKWQLTTPNAPSRLVGERPDCRLRLAERSVTKTPVIDWAAD